VNLNIYRKDKWTEAYVLLGGCRQVITRGGYSG